MSIPFTVDVSAFYGEPDATEQSSNTIVDRRKTLNLHKKLNNKTSTRKKTRKTKKQGQSLEGGAISMKQNSAGAIAVQSRAPAVAGAIGFKEGGAISMKQNSAGAIAMQSRAPAVAGALAFNEAQLMNELTGLKKGGALPALAAAVIPTLVEMAPQIIAAIKTLTRGQRGIATQSLKKPSGGAIKIGGASAVFLDGVDPSKYDDMIKTMKAIERQRKNLIREGGAIKVGSGKMGTFFKNAWNNIKSWYGNNAEKLKPITDILVNSAVNSANKMIDKGVKYVGDKTGSDTLKQIGNVVGNMAKSTVGNAASAVQNYGTQSGSGYSAALAGGYNIDNLDNTTIPAVVASKKKKILTAFPNNERRTTASQVSVKKSRSVYG